MANIVQLGSFSNLELDKVAKLDDPLAHLSFDDGHISRLRGRARRKHTLTEATIRHDEQEVASAVHRVQKAIQPNRTFDIDCTSILDEAEQQFVDDGPYMNAKHDLLETDYKVDIVTHRPWKRKTRQRT